MKKGIVFSMATGAMLLASAAHGQVFDNGVTPNTGLSSQLDTAYPFESAVADDFTIAGGATIGSVSWTGLQFNDPPDLPDPLEFNIFIYADNGAGTAPMYTGDGASSPAADALNVTNVVLNTGGGSGPWSYTADLDVPFVAAAGTTYWISIQAVSNFPPQWGWQGNNTGGNAVQGFPLLGTNFWTTVSPGTEMDFQLYAVPAPGVLALLGLAGVAGRRRRRA